MKNNKDILKKSVSVFFSYLYCNSLVQVGASESLLNREPVQWQRLIKYTERFKDNDTKGSSNLSNLSNTLLSWPWAIVTAVAAPGLFRWVLYPAYDASRNMFYYLIHPSYQDLSKCIGRPVELLLEHAKNIDPKDLEDLGKDLSTHGGWLQEEKSIQTLIKLWDIKVKFESDNMFKAFGKMVTHFTVYPIQKGTGISKDNENVMGSKNKNYPLRVHNGEAFDKPLEVVDAMCPTLSNAFNRVNSFDTRLVSTDFVVAQILHFFFDKGGLPYWKDLETEEASDTDIAINGAFDKTRKKGKRITWIKKKGDKIPFVHSVYDQGDCNLKSLGQTVNDGTRSFNTKGAVWYNDKAFFIKIPETCAIRQASDFIQMLKDITPSKDGKKLYQFSVANFVYDHLLQGAETNSHVFVFYR